MKRKLSMGEENNAKFTQSLEMESGLNGIDYPQKFVHAPKQRPYPCNYTPLDIQPTHPAMKISMGR